MAILRLHPPSGAPIELERDRTLLGRDPACNVVLDERSVSRRHVVVERRGPSWHVVDQGSANGTFLDGEQIAEAELRDGQELRLGNLRLGVEVESEVPQTVLMQAPEQAPPPPPPPTTRQPLPAPVAHEDLPSAQPVVTPEDLGDSLMEPVRAAPAAREAAPPDASGPPLATTALGTLIVLLLGASGYFWMSESRTAKDLSTLARSADVTAAQSDWHQYQPIDQLEKDGALRNGVFKLCNRSAEKVDVAWLGAVSLEEPRDAGQSYTVRSYNSLLCRQDFKLSLPPGAETPVAFESTNERCRFDGQGVFFALYVRRLVQAPPPARPGAPVPEPEEQTVYLSGLLNDRRDCVTIGEGW